MLLVLAAYTPLHWLLMAKLYKQVIDIRLTLSFWKYIWIIPALTYLIFYVKIVKDYWIVSGHTGPGDVVFIILWSFTTYAFFYVTLQMLIQSCKGITAMQQAEARHPRAEVQEQGLNCYVQKKEFEKSLDSHTVVQSIVILSSKTHICEVTIC